MGFASDERPVRAGDQGTVSFDDVEENPLGVLLEAVATEEVAVGDDERARAAALALEQALQYVIWEVEGMELSGMAISFETGDGLLTIAYHPGSTGAVVVKDGRRFPVPDAKVKELRGG